MNPRQPHALIALALAVALLLPGRPLRAQERRAPRIAVVLSGGGAKGLAHIGVLRVLEEEGLSPQIVTGTSMGALVGGLYAMGESPATLDSLGRTLDWASYFRDATDRDFVGLEQRLLGGRTLIDLPLVRGRITLPSGAIEGQRIRGLLARLTWRAGTVRDFRTLPRAFAAVATDIETGESVMLTRGSLADALRASMSTPGVFAPVLLDGRLLVDGGVTRNLPAQDARALGAERVICSDASDPLFPASQLHSMVDVLVQSLGIHMYASTVAERRLCDVYIRPDITGLTGSSFHRAGEAIARGVEAARAQRAGLRALRPALFATALPVPRPAPPGVPDSVRARRVVVEGIAGEPARHVRRALRLPDEPWVTAARLDSAVQRVHATQLYERVQYRLDGAGPDTTVVVSATAREQDRLGVGVRYDDAYKASMLFSAQLRNRLGFGSTVHLDLRLGEQTRAAADYVRTGVRHAWLALGAGGAYARTPVSIYEGDRRVAEVTMSVATATATAGAKLGGRGGVAVQLKGEHARAQAAIAGGDSSRTQALASGAVLLRWEALDRPAFPRRGVAAAVRSERAVGGAHFTQHVGSAQLAVPLGRRLTLQGRVAAGASTGGDALPLHYRLALGGARTGALFPDVQLSFVGLRPQEQLGTAAARLGATVQWEARRAVFASVRADVGYAGPMLTTATDAYRAGAGLGLGALTPFGPVEVTASATAWRQRPRVEFSLGHAF